MRFYDRAEIKDVLAYLRLLTNPEDDVSLLRVVNVPARGIGKKSVEKLLEDASRAGTGIWRALELAARGKGGPSKRFKHFVELMGVLRGRLASGDPLAAVAYAVYEDTGYKQALKDQDTPEADARMQNIEELLGAIQLAQEENPELTLTEFLEAVTLDSAGDEEEQPEEKLTLMTVHAAKGLEFPVVFVAGLEEDTIPFKRGQDPLEEEELEEERRLAYVALTRAEERLMLTWAQTRRLFRDKLPKTESRFLLELPADDVRQLGQRRAAVATASNWRGYRGVREWERPKPRAVPSGDSYVDRTEGSDFEGETIQVGMRVTHRKFGLGKIVDIKPTTPPRVDVRFSDGGVKTIQVSYLQPA